MRYFLVTLICALTPLVAAAQSYIAVNRLQVVAINASEFEVIEARGEGARGMWCAAADYVTRTQGHRAGQRLYVKTPRGPSVTVQGRKGAIFTTDASRLPNGPKQSVSVSVKIAGLGLPVNHAIQFCKDYQIELEDILLRRLGD